jgi:hypothetical protein
LRVCNVNNSRYCIASEVSAPYSRLGPESGGGVPNRSWLTPPPCPRLPRTIEFHSSADGLEHVPHRLGASAGRRRRAYAPPGHPLAAVTHLNPAYFPGRVAAGGVEPHSPAVLSPPVSLVPTCAATAAIVSPPRGRSPCAAVRMGRCVRVRLPVDRSSPSVFRVRSPSLHTPSPHDRK